ncbi:MAG: hypothetical protein GTO16_13845, partial [Candidatus Aminicenantes bacterium]|nr:hypothetical protein [Candidatus Aminicenantes bacterium]
MHIDEAWHHELTTGIDHLPPPAPTRSFSCGGLLKTCDSTILNHDIKDLIHLLGRIHNPSILYSLYHAVPFLKT